MFVQDTLRAGVAGIVGTMAMSMAASMAPMMGLPPMNPAAMMAEPMGGSLALGWMAHLMVGVVLAQVFVHGARHALPGPVAARGALFAIAPWLMAQVVVMPMMGMGLFSGSAGLAMGSLIGHLVYGAVLGGLLTLTDAPALEVVEA
jgi:hypothetical protein